MKMFLRILSVFMLTMMLCLPTLPVLAEEGVVDEPQYETGYNRGYEGGKNGDGKLYAHGLGISVWQGGSFNFNAAKAAGFSYIIIRAGVTYEKDGAYVTEKDEYFESNYENAKAAGLDVGVYFYSMARSTEEALSEAETLLGYIEGKIFEYPVYMDFEAPAVRTHLEADGSRAKPICEAFLDRIAEAGYLAGLYSSSSWIDSGAYNGWMGDEADELGEKYELWVACYFNDGTYTRKGEEYSERFGMYQYTSSKYISGYSGRLDANICYKDYPSIVKKYGFNGYEADDSIAVGGSGLTEESKFRLGKYTIDTASSKTGLYNEPDKDSGTVGYVTDGNLVNAVEACAVWGIDWVKVETEDGLCGWIKGSNLKRYKETTATDPQGTAESESATDEQSTDASATGGCGSSFGASALVISCAAVLVIAAKKRKKD
jgi:GH25 family lysozyme M1 (1,4-beta-N-acetylmuramidase)